MLASGTHLPRIEILPLFLTSLTSPMWPEFKRFVAFFTMSSRKLSPEILPKALIIVFSLYCHFPLIFDYFLCSVMILQHLQSSVDAWDKRMIIPLEARRSNSGARVRKEYIDGAVAAASICCVTWRVLQAGWGRGEGEKDEQGWMVLVGQFIIFTRCRLLYKETGLGCLRHRLVHLMKRDSQL